MLSREEVIAGRRQQGCGRRGTRPRGTRAAPRTRRRRSVPFVSATSASAPGNQNIEPSARSIREPSRRRQRDAPLRAVPRERRPPARGRAARAREHAVDEALARHGAARVERRRALHRGHARPRRQAPSATARPRARRRRAGRTRGSRRRATARVLACGRGHHAAHRPRGTDRRDRRRPRAPLRVARACPPVRRRGGRPRAPPRPAVFWRETASAIASGVARSWRAACRRGATRSSAACPRRRSGPSSRRVPRRGSSRRGRRP